MADHSRAIAASVLGAIIGGISGYLLMTEQGRATRRQLERTFVDFSRELHSLRQLIEEGSTVLGQAWTTVKTALGETRTTTRPFPVDREASVSWGG